MFWDHYSNHIDKILLWELVFQKEMYRIIDVEWMRFAQPCIHQGRIRRQPGHMIQTKTRSGATYSLNHSKQKTSRVRSAKSFSGDKWMGNNNNKKKQVNTGACSETPRAIVAAHRRRVRRGESEESQTRVCIWKRGKKKKMPNLQRRRLAFLHSWDNLPLFSPSHFSAEPWQLFEVPLGETGIVV